MIYSTKMRHTRSCFANYSITLSLSLTQNEWTKIILTLRVFSEKSFSWMRDYETFLKSRFKEVVFYTISLKQISSLTQLLWCFETHGRLSPKIKLSTVRKWSTQDCALRTTQCLFLSLWHKMNKQKLFSRWEFFLKSLFHEWETMKLICY